jgi:hypothetical protein
VKVAHRQTIANLAEVRCCLALSHRCPAREKGRWAITAIGFVPFEKLMTSIHEIWSKKIAACNQICVQPRIFEQKRTEPVCDRPVVAPSAQKSNHPNYGLKCHKRRREHTLESATLSLSHPALFAVRPTKSGDAFEEIRLTRVEANRKFHSERPRPMTDHLRSRAWFDGHPIRSDCGGPVEIRS